MAKKRGRPREPVPEPLPSRTIVVYYKVPGSEEVRQFAEHLNVPGDWSRGMILERFGIREHLKVIIKTEGRDSVLQNFPRNEL